MTTNYTKVAKPTTSYSNIFAPGKEIYDYAVYTYNESTVNYDGSPLTTYTKISKPTTSYTKVTKAT